MRHRIALLIALVLIGGMVTDVRAQQTTGPSWLKSMGQAAVQVGAQALSPQAQSIVDQAKTLGTLALQENFIVTKAKTFMGEKNYDLALQLANYVVTKINSKSVSAQAIVTDAKAALAKYAQDKLTQTQTQSAQAQQAQQVQSDASQAAGSAKSLLGSFGVK